MLSPYDRPASLDGRRQRLVAATVEVAGERGWHATSVEAIAAAAGVSKRTIYELAGDRLACLLEAAHHQVDRITLLLVGACREAGEPRAGIPAAIGALLRFCGADPRAARFYLVEIAAAGPAATAVWYEHMEEIAARAERAMRGLRPGLPSHAGSMAVGGVYAVARNRVLAGEASRLPDLAPDLTAAIWTTLGLGRQ